ncbi:NADH dehydrogenase [Calidithermus timidus]|jgi:hydrogenase-4 component E|uniref:NADH dehydrogenase n=1 Tax=Calidithermus timidus TaxID=307124 RepID=UPI00036719AD|nr:NADH dehydrogenase [Calidithermus timidus]
MVGRKSLDALIRLYALQSMLLALLAFVLAEGEQHFVLAGMALLLLKGVLIPRYLFWLLERLGVSHEVESYLSIPLSLLLGGVLVGVGFRVGSAFVLEGARLPEAVPVALSLILLGMLSMVSRKKAVTQVLGFLALENGVFLLALAETHGLPLFIELGVALDAFAAVVLAGVLISRIRAIFDHIDTARMRDLKG